MRAPLAAVDARRRQQPIVHLARALCAALWAALLLVMLAALTGCATPPAPRHPSASDTGPWSGRLSITIQTEPPQRFYAGFTLEGNADAGSLALTSPLGNTVAALHWQPGLANLNRGGQVQTYPSLDELVTHATGSPLPVRALFDWLRGQDTLIEGWQADLSALPQGQLTAQRLSPPPAAQLRMALDR